MALEGLEPVLEMLYQRSQFRLIVHPEDAEEAHKAVRRSFMLGLVRVIPSSGMPRGDAMLMAAEQTWSFRSVPDTPATATSAPLGA